jgi:hypothetical protein
MNDVLLVGQHILVPITAGCLTAYFAAWAASRVLKRLGAHADDR